MARNVKSAKERAEAALAVANRRVARLDAEAQKLSVALRAAGKAAAEAAERRDYLAKDPALSPVAAEPGDESA